MSAEIQTGKAHSWGWRWLSHKVQALLLQRTYIFSTHVRWLTVTHNASSRGSDAVTQACT